MLHLLITLLMSLGSIIDHTGTTEDLKMKYENQLEVKYSIDEELIGF